MQRVMGSGRPSVSPPEQSSLLAAVAVNLSGHFSWLLGMIRVALHGKPGDSLRKYLGRLSSLIPGSAQGLSWNRLLVELLGNAEWCRFGVCMMIEWPRGTEQIHRLLNVGQREGDLWNTFVCSRAAVICPLRWPAWCRVSRYVSQQRLALAWKEATSLPLIPTYKERWHLDFFFPPSLCSLQP